MMAPMAVEPMRVRPPRAGLGALVAGGATVAVLAFALGASVMSGIGSSGGSPVPSLTQDAAAAAPFPSTGSAAERAGEMIAAGRVDSTLRSAFDVAAVEGWGMCRLA